MYNYIFQNLIADMVSKQLGKKKNPTARYAVNRGKNKANILKVLYLDRHSNCKKSAILKHLRHLIEVS